MRSRPIIKGKRPLFEKAAQKLLLNWARDGETSTTQINKAFLLFFAHKK
jgi:hypothetical protein